MLLSVEPEQVLLSLGNLSPELSDFEYPPKINPPSGVCFITRRTSSSLPAIVFCQASPGACALLEIQLKKHRPRIKNFFIEIDNSP